MACRFKFGRAWAGRCAARKQVGHEIAPAHEFSA
jgi:hypothetical protein